jgi:putative membrane protein
VLIAYGLGALTLTLLAARRSRRMTASDLHPELVL